MTHAITLLGATGFAGRLVARYLATQLPDGMTWAVAGRNRDTLEALRDDLAAHGTEPDVVQADITDPASMRALAEQTRVLATTVGPYVEYGDAAVAACAQTGTDYCDLTGEPEFVDRTWLRHHAEAERTGARLVHACGFDSVPHDLGALFTVSHLPEGVPTTVRAYVQASATASGGTYHSAVRAFSRVRQAGAVAEERRGAEERVGTRRVRALPMRPVRGPDGTGWGLPMPTLDPVIVRRSARALDVYGPDFGYGQYALFKGLPYAVGTAAGLGGMVAAAQVRPLRDALLRVKSQGDGPDAITRARSWYRIRFVGEAGDETVRTEVSGGDPGYDETARMFGESALCLAQDDLPVRAGQLTTAVAMGPQLLDRLDFARVL